MPYIRLGDSGEPPAATSITLEILNDKADAMMRELVASERRRKIASYIAIGSALFAGLRLGILAIPSIREKQKLRF